MSAVSFNVFDPEIEYFDPFKIPFSGNGRSVFSEFFDVVADAAGEDGFADTAPCCACSACCCACTACTACKS